jgi:hypothetical protein
VLARRAHIGEQAIERDEHSQGRKHRQQGEEGDSAGHELDPVAVEGLDHAPEYIEPALQRNLPRVARDPAASRFALGDGFEAGAGWLLRPREQLVEHPGGGDEREPVGGERKSSGGSGFQLRRAHGADNGVTAAAFRTGRACRTGPPGAKARFEPAIGGGS